MLSVLAYNLNFRERCCGITAARNKTKKHGSRLVSPDINFFLTRSRCSSIISDSVVWNCGDNYTPASRYKSYQTALAAE